MVEFFDTERLEFYESCGMRPKPELVVKYCQEWEEFVVT